MICTYPYDTLSIRGPRKFPAFLCYQKAEKLLQIITCSSTNQSHIQQFTAKWKSKLMLNYFFFVPVFCMRMYCCYEYVVGHLKAVSFLVIGNSVLKICEAKCLQVHATSSLSVHQHNTFFLPFLKSGQRTEKTFSVQQGKFHYPTKIDPSVFSSHIPQSPWTVRSQPLEAAACAKKDSDDVRWSMAVPPLGTYQCRESFPSGLFHHHV